MPTKSSSDDIATTTSVWIEIHSLASEEVEEAKEERRRRRRVLLFSLLA